MSTLIFDIETIGEDWQSLDETTQHALTRWVDRAGRTPLEREALLADVRKGLGFSPLTGSVVALGIYDRERALGTVYYRGDGSGAEEESGVFILKERSEEEMLRLFWEGVQHYQVFVTFNGRSFDLPFLIHRSLVLGIVPQTELLRRRYLSQQVPPYHIDLQDELTFYGAMSRRPSLHLFCRAYGIESPKQELSGEEVTGLFTARCFLEIARYNARDLLATAALYEKWLEYLAPTEWRQNIDF